MRRRVNTCEEFEQLKKFWSGVPREFLRFERKLLNRLVARQFKLPATGRALIDLLITRQEARRAREAAAIRMFFVRKAAREAKHA